MPRLILLCGLPGTGKSTYASNFLTQAQDTTLYLSSDALIEEWAEEAGLSYQDAYPDMKHKAAIELASRAAYAAENNVDVLWDGTHLTPEYRAERTDLFPLYDQIAVAFEAPADVRAQRMLDRFTATGKFIPPEVVHQMEALYIRPSFDEGFENIVIITPEGAVSLE